MIFLMLLFTSAALFQNVLGAEEPQVHEHPEDINPGDLNYRSVRQPLKLQKPTKVYQPPQFDYQMAMQQDHRRNRYAQQQISDMKHLTRLTPHQDTSAWKPIDPQHSASEIKEVYTSPQGKANQTIKGRTNRKLHPMSFFEEAGDFESQKNSPEIRRQDQSGHYIYVTPQAFSSHHPKADDQDLRALSALIGQNPNTQLEGLKQLLDSPQHNYILPPLRGPPPFPSKDHTPIMEHVVDIPNHQSRPNIKTQNKVPLQTLQAQLDLVSQQRAQDLLARAQEAAIASVEAQHRAIVQARAEAEQAALEKIQEANAVVLPVKVEQEVPPVQKISITKTHSVTQGHHTPNAFQTVVMETQHQKVYPSVAEVEKVEDEHQYASRYAFGYRIKDVKMGNDFGHEEKRDGKNAKGHYHVLLPDGRLQKVEYYADPTGYHAKVTYENIAHH